LVGLAADPAVVAIGETGLDYHYNAGDLDWQRARFRRSHRCRAALRQAADHPYA
jgi:TatD DNase family protein